MRSDPSLGKLRATYDRRVVDAWAGQLAARGRGMGRVLLGFAIVLPVLLALVLVTKAFPFVLLFFGAFVALIVVTWVDRGSLHCPNCNRAPLGAFERGPATGADFCPHCFYWLKPPYGAGHDAQS